MLPYSGFECKQSSRKRVCRANHPAAPMVLHRAGARGVWRTGHGQANAPPNRGGSDGARLLGASWVITRVQGKSPPSGQGATPAGLWGTATYHPALRPQGPFTAPSPTLASRHPRVCSVKREGEHTAYVLSAA